MRINCLSCGHNMDLDDAYDDYEGPFKCFMCNAARKMAVSRRSGK